jgi:hypothetical protein
MQFPRRSMRVALGTFTRAGIEARFGSDVKAGMEAALRHYTRRLRSNRPPMDVPAFAPEHVSTGSDDAFELEVAAEIERGLEREAKRQGVSTAVLLRHAALVYLADLDANVGESSSSRVEEGVALSRYQRRCASLATPLPAAARRHVGSA